MSPPKSKTLPARKAQDVSIAKVRMGKEAFRKRVLNALVRYNRAKGGQSRWKSLEIGARSPEGKLLGGLFGESYWGWLYVSVLWVHEKQRSRRIGSRLLRAAEEEGRLRGCKFIYLDSYTFQAPVFYKKLGYKVFGQLKDFPKGFSKFFLYKKL